MCGRGLCDVMEVTQAAKRADLKQCLLSVTIWILPLSPLSGSVRSSTEVTPSSFSTSVRAA